MHRTLFSITTHIYYTMGDLVKWRLQGADLKNKKTTKQKLRIFCFLEEQYYIEQ